MILDYKVSVLAYLDSAATEFPEQVVFDFSKELLDQSVDEAQMTSISLAASGSQAITVNGVATIKRLVIYSDTSELTVVLNGNNFTMPAGITGVIPFTITSLSLTNNSSTDATVVTVMLITGD